jgi:diacylglycerol O-acyltransferase
MSERSAKSLPKTSARPSWPVVPLSDQALYLAHTAAGHEAVIQVLWRYRHPVSIDGLRQFQSHLERGLLARLIRPATLPVGRHHWVGVRPTDSTLAVGGQPLTPGDLHAWADEQVQRSLDPAQGPGWNLAVQPVTDGSTAVSLVVSHCIADGAATAMAVCEAVRGERRDMAYPPHTARQRLTASIAHESRQLLQDGPETVRALAHLVATGLRAIGAPRPKRSRASSPSRVVSTSPDQIINLPSVSIAIPSEGWRSRAKHLGVSDTTLLTAISAALAARLGRARDGSAVVLLPIDARSNAPDRGGNQVSIATLRVNVDTSSGSLRDLQRALQSTIRTARRTPGPLETLLPLIPFVPRWVVGAVSNRAFGLAADLPVTCSHMGVLPPEMVRIDGTDAEVFLFRGVDRQLSRRSLERRGGVATVLSGFAGDSLLLNFVAYQPGVVTDSAHLQAIAEAILAAQQLRGDVLL